jgi:hypothetical protein
MSAQPITELRRARSDFAAAHDRLHSSVLAPLRLLPVVGRQLHSLEAVTGAAGDIAAISADGLAEAQSLIGAGHATGPQRVELLRGMAQIASRTDARLAHVGFGTGEALAWPASSARNRLVRQYERLRIGLTKGSAAASATADLLEGPRRYLVLAANNAEMRAGSGMFLSVGVMQTSGGTISLSDFQSTVSLQLPPGAVPLTGDLEARWGWLRPTEEWRNLGASPRFDATAPLAAQMWAAGGHPPVDGALAVDVQALKDVLGAVGPVEVAGEPVDASDVVERVLHGQYVAHQDDPDQGARREELGEVAKATMTAVDERTWSVGALASGLAHAARGRHLMAWAATPSEQAGWIAGGIDGSLDGDSMLLGVLNRGANKLDRFLGVGAHLKLRRAGGKTVGELRVDLRNEVPPGEPRYVAGPWSDAVPRDAYVGILAVDLPADSRNGRVDGESQLVAAGADGPARVVACSFSLARGESKTFVVRFDLPHTRQRLTVRPSGRVPPVPWEWSGHRWQDDADHAVAW